MFDSLCRSPFFDAISPPKLTDCVVPWENFPGTKYNTGFDESRLDTRFLLLPNSFEGRVEQYAGRLHREHEGKTEKLSDCVVPWENFPGTKYNTGFDESRLDTRFLLLPNSFEGRVEQYAGRLHREHEGKTDVRIYEYVNWNHPMLKEMLERLAHSETGTMFTDAIGLNTTKRQTKVNPPSIH